MLAERFPRSGAESAESCQSALVSDRPDIVSEIRARVVQRDYRFAAERQGTHGTRLCNGITAVPGDSRLIVLLREGIGFYQVCNDFPNYVVTFFG